MTTDAWLLAGLGGMAVATAVGDAVWSLLGMLTRRTPATGTVIDWDRAPFGDPIIEFATADGETVRFVARGAGWLDRGQTVPIRYNSRRPRRARVATIGMGVKPIVFLLIALLMLSLTWTQVQRMVAVPAGERVTAYLALLDSVHRLDACAQRPCRGPLLKRRMRSYDRARISAAPLASPGVNTQIAALQRSLVDVRRAGRRPRAASLAALSRTLTEETGKLIQDCDATDARC